MIPYLYDRFEYYHVHDQPVWNDIRIGRLRDALSCVETSSVNAEWELIMEYPMNGFHANDIQLMRVIYTSQPFFIYQITKNAVAHTMTVYARHLSYLLSYIPAWPFNKTNVSPSVFITTAISRNCPFRFQVDETMEAQTADVNMLTVGGVPASSMRDFMLNPEYGMIGFYGGEWVFDGFTCWLVPYKGTRKDITIRYGVDLVDAKQQEALDNLVTHVVPYAYVTTPISGPYNLTSMMPVQKQDREYWGTFPDKYGVTVYSYYLNYTYTQTVVEATPHLIIRPPADDSTETETFPLNNWYVGTTHTYALPGAEQIPFKRVMPVNLMEEYNSNGSTYLVGLMSSRTNKYGDWVTLTTGYVTDDGSSDTRTTTQFRPYSQEVVATGFQIFYNNLRDMINKYVNAHPVTFPVDITVQSLPEFMTGVRLGDTITVEYPDYGISTEAEIMTMEYDVLRDRIASYTLGKGQTSFAETMLHQDNKIEQLNGLVTANNPRKGT